METVAIIIGSIGGLLGAIFGGVEFVKLIMTKKAVKKAAQLENNKTLQELTITSGDTKIGYYERLAQQHEKDLEYYRAVSTEKDSLLREKDTLLEEKNRAISDLREKLDDTRSELVRAQLLRCTCLSCANRIPPLGYTESSIEAVYKEN